MARGRQGNAAAVLAVAALVGLGVAAAPAGGQATPTLTVDPVRTGPGQAVTVTLAGCLDPGPDGPSVSYGYRFDDVLNGLAMTEASPGTWTGTISSGSADVTVRSFCDGAELTAEVDTDRPVLLPMPWAPPGSFPDPPQSYLGTDCPDGTTARTFFQVDGWPGPVLVTSEIDARGDWTAAVPAFPDGLRVWVEASCGSVRYPSTDYVSGGSSTLLTTTSTTAPPTGEPLPLPQAPAPATPLPGTPTLTG